MKKIVLPIKILIDVAMSSLLLCIMGYHLFGEKVHEWLGISIFVLFLIHNGLNWRWYKNLFRGKYKATRIYKLIMNLVLWILMACNIASAMLISVEVFVPFNINGNIMTGRQLHLFATMWTFIFMSLHLGQHFPLFIGMARRLNLSNKTRTIFKWILRVILFGFSIYGIVVFIQRAMWEEMFLTTHFKFLQYGEPIIKFLFDYICLVCLFGALGYYSNKWLLILSKKNKNKKKVYYGI
ncbi:MAG: hypothetical protein K2J85_00030 [Anaeroplasmataceae bacterium]|nr:hypothetical protein [Anaeroplasmataceae bacterium]